jgi:hypothetical protein
LSASIYACWLTKSSELSDSDSSKLQLLFLGAAMRARMTARMTATMTATMKETTTAAMTVATTATMAAMMRRLVKQTMTLCSPARGLAVNSWWT